MAQPKAAASTTLTIKGLYSNPSQFGGNTPEGALTIANNVVIDRPSVVATRRGRDNTYASVSGTIEAMTQFQSSKVAWNSAGAMYVDETGNGNFIQLPGVYLRPSEAVSPALLDPIPLATVSGQGSRVRSLEQNNNLYFLTHEGTYRLDTPTGTPRRAGAPPGLQGSAITLNTPGFLPVNSNIAYRVVFGFKDLNNTLVLGAPSARIVCSNTTAFTTNVQVTIQIPKEIQASPTNWIYQLYRGHPSVNLTTPPDDEMSLVTEGGCAGTPTMEIFDSSPNYALGPALYTNTGQEGINQSNYRPPWALDIALFEQRAFYANTRDIETTLLTLISAYSLFKTGGFSSGFSNGFTSSALVGDTLKFTREEDSVSFAVQAGTVNNYSTGVFALSNTGNIPYDIAVTAYNICLIINGYAPNTFITAYYISTDNDRPGQMKFDRNTLIDKTFTITSITPNAFSEPIPAVSNNTKRPNRIYFSKPNETEAVPLTNYVEVGSASQRIDRILRLQNGLIVLKQDGIFRVSTGSPYQVQLLDSTVRILAPNTAVVGDNKVWFLSDQGVVACTETDVTIESFILDNVVVKETSQNLYPNLGETAWAIAYQADRKYELWLPSFGTDTQATQALIFNYMVKNWTRWTMKGTCGMIYNVDGKMYFGSESGSAPGTNKSYIYKERKSFTASDYADDQFSSVSYTEGTTDTVVCDNFLLPSLVSVQPGWTLACESTGAVAQIVSVTVGAQTTIVVDSPQLWSNSEIWAYVPVLSEIQTIQMDCQNPAMNKQFVEASYVFTEQSFSKLKLSITSNMSSSATVDYLIPQATTGWGSETWGSSPWGSSTPVQGKIRRFIPRTMQRMGWIYINLKNEKAFTGFGFSGMVLSYNITSTRQF